jgi:alpha-beta hydrolase superfamily lysophospholipase
VVAYLKRRKFRNICAVGHSFGGLTLLQAKTSALTAVSFWDMTSFISFPPKFWFRKDKNTGATYTRGSYELLMSRRYVNGIKNFPDELGLISKIKVPCQICYASGEGAMLVESSRRYYAHLSADKELVAIPHASHSFTEEGIAENLFSKTEKWFRKYCA